MGILMKMAWRNVWRNPRRSWVVVTAIAVGVFSFVGSTVFMDGFAFQMIDAGIDLQGGQIQIAARGYEDSPSIRKFIGEEKLVEDALTMGMQAAPQVLAQGMVNSAEQAAGIVIHGVDPQRESAVTIIAASVVEGRYLAASDGAGQILIGSELAHRLKVRLGEKVVIMANDLHNEISAGAYRVVGLYRTNSIAFDKGNVFLHLSEVQRLLGYDRQVTLYALRLPRDVVLHEAVATLRERLEPAGLEVRSWEDRFPLLVLMKEAYDYSVVLLVVILFTAVAFTIVNSFLMVILERIHEIGVMMAGGVRPRQVRRMLYLEAGVMVMLGLIAGILLSVLILGYWTANGMDLSAFAEGLGVYGISPIVYPYLDWGHLSLGFALIVVMVMLAVLYPAYKASAYEVVEAIHYV